MKKIFNSIMLVAVIATANICYAQTIPSEDNPIDRTDFIVNPSFENGTTGWTVSNLVSQSNNSFTQKEGTFYLEKWVSSGSAGNANVKQIITKLPVGLYKLTAGAQNISQSTPAKENTGVKIFANDEQTDVYTANDYSIKFKYVGGQVEIGYVSQNAGGNWIAVDNFRLYQIGDVDKSEVIPSLQAKITEVEAFYDAEKEGSAEFLSEINKAKGMIEDSASSADDLAQEISALDFALFAFRIANPEQGPGTAPKVSSTNHYAPTGSTEALVRASMTGSNILERGVCWSTEHNPTVLNDRTTEYHQLNGYIFHIRNLKPATVYYVRPYIMNKTYMVAYGDEVKIVTHPKGTCVGTWNNGAPTEEANIRCRTAINQTIEYFNQWTGIRGFTLTGNYGAQTQTADCSYGGWMRIGPNPGNQAIGTVIHETGHGVGVGTHWRWNNCTDTRESEGKYGKWLGREANDMLHFLENNYDATTCYMRGDAVHGWGNNATYDWFVNGADKDKHLELQYLGGCCLLYALFIDGLCPTSNHPNGLSGYTYNFDSEKKYYLMCKNADYGLGSGLLYARSSSATGWNEFLTKEEVGDEAAWYIEYDATKGYYIFKNVSNGRYLTHASGSTSIGLKNITGSKKPSDTEFFQLMPDRTDVTLKADSKQIKTHGYWFTWYDNGNKSIEAGKMGALYGSIKQSAFDFSNKATAQQWIIISEDELEKYIEIAIATGIETIEEESADSSDNPQIVEIYNSTGIKINSLDKGVNIVKYSNGEIKKIFK